MFDLFSRYSLSDIILFLILLAGGIISGWKGLEWLGGKLQEVFSKDSREAIRRGNCETRFKNLEHNYDELKQILDKILLELETLNLSDKDNIKAYITDRHHYFYYGVGWIDDYSLDILERRYCRYKEEGGNSFIDSLMSELRALPRKELDTPKNL